MGLDRVRSEPETVKDLASLVHIARVGGTARLPDRGATPGPPDPPKATEIDNPHQD
jgi:hypothetical protein